MGLKESKDSQWETKQEQQSKRCSIVKAEGSSLATYRRVKNKAEMERS